MEALTALAAEDDRIVLATGDLGFMVVEPFAEAFPDRFLNLGVAEQHLVGVATGMAHDGLRPFAYSITPFLTHRALEMLRDGPDLHGLPVHTVGVGVGHEYGPAGHSHHAVDDLAALRTLPSTTVVTPIDDRDAADLLRRTHRGDGPVHHRLSKRSRVLDVPRPDGLAPANVGHGADVLLVTLGSTFALGLEVRDALARDGVEVDVLGVRAFAGGRPLGLDGAFDGRRLVVTIEDHVLPGGLGEAVAGIVADGGSGPRLVRHGIPSGHSPPGLGAAALDAWAGLTTPRLVAAIARAVA